MIFITILIHRIYKKTAGIKITDTTKNVKKSSSFVKSKRHQDREQIDFDEAAERRNSKRLRESIRKKYNLPTRD